MAKVKVKAYASPTAVLLAFDWAEGRDYNDFLGFAIQREPGFNDFSRSWLPNRIGFFGPSKIGRDFPTGRCPIQKFMWWDSRFDLASMNRTYTYTVIPVRGNPRAVQHITQAGVSIKVILPKHHDNKVGIYFNRAVVSSQAFSKRFGRKLEKKDLPKALAWLANGMEKVIPQFLETSPSVEGAIYHLTDEEWVIPAMITYNKKLSLVYDARKPEENKVSIKRLGSEPKVQLLPRKKAKIMHNKFLVRISGGKPTALLMGSANFTTAGLTTQANVLHTFESAQLAELYLQRKKLLEDDPSLGKVAQTAGWSKPISVGGGTIRAFFSPEKKPKRDGIDAVVNAVKNAKRSVVFCIFTPTDKKLRDAIFDAANRGKMMFGLINSISRQQPKNDTSNAGAVAKVEIYHRSRTNKDVYAHGLFSKGRQPVGFWWEVASIPGSARKKFPVYIHHKFILVDAETDHPTVYTGSANMSTASTYNNDENLLEIKGDKGVAQMYLCEFLRLYEHYRARRAFENWRKSDDTTFRLVPDSSWAKKAYTKGTPEYKCRINMAST